MRSRQKCHGIIPARYQSSRFPGKPLALLMGRPMFWHVYQQAIQCRQFTRVVLATDDERIYSAAQDLEVPAVMTRSDHPSGTDRVLEASERLNLPDEEIVVNIQGDEPLVAPEVLESLIVPFDDSQTRVTTAATPMDGGEAINPDRVKVVFDAKYQALYFSRAPIPHHRTAVPGDPYYLHIGLYAFRKAVLKRFVALGPSPLEKAEKLEQLRLLENGIAIHVVLTQYRGIGVDRPEDLKVVIDQIKKAPPAYLKKLSR
jgi:3-deoxy-manno-octulosonate cytidylyltransferase (CMP-KDO synthetase)